MKPWVSKTSRDSFSRFSFPIGRHPVVLKQAFHICGNKNILGADLYVARVAFLYLDGGTRISLPGWWIPHSMRRYCSVNHIVPCFAVLARYSRKLLMTSFSGIKLLSNLKHNLSGSNCDCLFLTNIDGRGFLEQGGCGVGCRYGSRIRVVGFNPA